MSTINDKNIILTIIKNNGFYPDDPQVNSVFEYTSPFGTKCWKLCYKPNNVIEFIKSPSVFNPLLLWDKEDGLTYLGEIFIKENDK